MVTAAKQINRNKAGREVLYFDVPEKTGIVSVIGADTALGTRMVKHLCKAGKTVYGFTQEKDFKFSLKPILSMRRSDLTIHRTRFCPTGWFCALIRGWALRNIRLDFATSAITYFGKNNAVTSCSSLQQKFANQVSMASRKNPWSHLTRKLGFASLPQKTF